jgi:NitT/TauT family transport system substrate-binding protein
VKYEPLSPRRKDFELIVSLMVETGVLDRAIPFEDFVDTRFAEGSAAQTPWRYEAGWDHAF